MLRPAERGVGLLGYAEERAAAEAGRMWFVARIARLRATGVNSNRIEMIKLNAARLLAFRAAIFWMQLPG